jgi:chromate transporter
MPASDPPAPGPGSSAAAPGRRPPGLWALLRAFGAVGATSMGGGRFTFFYQEFVRRRRWIRETEILEVFGVSQILPGPNIGNFAVVLGQRLRGLRGAVLALLALLLPGAALMLVLSTLYFGRGEVPALSSILRGVAAAAAGMTLATALQIGYSMARSVRGVVTVLLAAGGIAILHLPIVLAILVLGATGIFLSRPRRGGTPGPIARDPTRTGSDEAAGPPDGDS